MDANQVKPELIREWLNALVDEPGWRLLRDRLQIFVEEATERICKPGVTPDVANYYRGVRVAYLNVLELRRDLFEETLERDLERQEEPI